MPLSPCWWNPACPALSWAHTVLPGRLSDQACGKAREHDISLNKQGGMLLSPWHLLPLSRLDSKNATARKQIDYIFWEPCQLAVNKREECGLALAGWEKLYYYKFWTRLKREAREKNWSVQKVKVLRTKDEGQEWRREADAFSHQGVGLLESPVPKVGRKKMHLSHLLPPRCENCWFWLGFEANPSFPHLI